MENIVEQEISDLVLELVTPEDVILKPQATLANTDKFEAEFMTDEMLRIVRPDKFENVSIDMSRFTFNNIDNNFIAPPRETLTIKGLSRSQSDKIPLTKKQQRNMDKKNKKNSNR